MKDDAECKILMGDVQVMTSTTTPIPKGKLCETFTYQKTLKEKDLFTWFFVSHTSIFNEWSFHVFRNFLIMHCALLVFKMHADQIRSWKYL